VSADETTELLPSMLSEQLFEAVPLRPKPRNRLPALLAATLLLPLGAGCRSPAAHRAKADRAAARLIGEAQEQSLGRSEPLDIVSSADTLRRRLLLGQELPHGGPASLGTHALPRPPHWPRDAYPADPDAPEAGDAIAAPALPDPLRLTLIDALTAAAAGNRDFQARKEEVYRAALALDLEQDAFRASFSGQLQALLGTTNPGGDDRVSGVVYSGEAGVSQKLQSGATATVRLAVDLAQLLTQDGASARAFLADATVTVPLLRGAGRHIVREPLTQAERNVVYAIHTFERFKQTFAVQVANDYLGVLRQQDEVRNAIDNYRSLSAAARRARRLADAGRLPEIQVDQASQDELRARSRWIVARLGYTRRLDNFKLLLGLPPDARIELDPAELQVVRGRFAHLLNAPVQPGADAPESGDPTAGEPAVDSAFPEEAEMTHAALDNRFDLRTATARVADAQRRVVVAADALRAGLTLTAAGSSGGRRGVASAGGEDVDIRLREGVYSGLLRLDLPWQRTAERKAYRESLISLEVAVRDLQRLEDDVKLQVRNALRSRHEARETVAIQTEAARLAGRRVASIDLFLQAGRAEIRDLLEAQEALVSAQNALTAALVSYRIAELDLQRDTGLLQVDANGLWQEPAHAIPAADTTP
jgi:outer membrane protein TolC